MKDKAFTSKLTLENVSHSYGTVAVLKDLSLNVNPGEIVVLVGPSGWLGQRSVLDYTRDYSKVTGKRTVQQSNHETVYPRPVSPY